MSKCLVYMQEVEIKVQFGFKNFDTLSADLGNLKVKIYHSIINYKDAFAVIFLCFMKIKNITYLLTSPADYAARLGYNWKATSNLRGDINIKYTKPDLLGNPDMSSILEFERRENLNEITTEGRFTVLPGAP